MKGYLGEIRWVTDDYTPQNWAHCNGQNLPVHEYPELFGLLRTVYGGDGKRSFTLPDLTDREKLQGGRFLICARGPMPLLFAS